MRILVTNDDGIDAAGIGILADAAEQIVGEYEKETGNEGEVRVIAPAFEQSATSHAITMTRPLRYRRLDGRRSTVDGTPTDCVFLAVKAKRMNPRPTLVLSGVNHGSNMGDDITYSGTVAAAIEANLLGIPAIAFSLAARENLNFETAKEWIPRIVRRFRTELTNKRPPSGESEPKPFWNVNFPNLPPGEIGGIRVTHLGRHTYEGSVFRDEETDSYRIGGGELAWERDPGSDFHTVFEDRCVSITPIRLDLNDYKALAFMRPWRWEWEER